MVVKFPPPRGGGPVEARTQTVEHGCRLPRSHFRPRAGAAPLKLHDRIRIVHVDVISAPARGGPVEALQTPRDLTADSHFRPRAGAAPLKHGANVAYVDVVRDFRPRAGAAPLKPDHWNLTAYTPIPFPPPRGGGPVEAPPFAGSTAAPHTFPPPRGGGPVEASTRP